jgi:hypothetical protein
MPTPANPLSWASSEIPVFPTLVVATSTPVDINMPIEYLIFMKRTALFLKPEQVKKLQVLSEKTGAPVAELIRRAIDKYLKERAKELK